MQLVSTTLHTPVGDMRAIASEQGICMFDFPWRRMSEKVTTRITGGTIPAEGRNKHIEQLEAELADWFGGKIQNFTVPLHPIGSPFQLRVWDALRQIPFGETRTYMQQALVLGDALAIRAVATANGANGIAILIPCHRVIGADGSLTGYAGGLRVKEWLLKHEGMGKTQGMLF